jgi:hypothetical protein
VAEGVVHLLRSVTGQLAASSRESDRYLMQRPLHFRHSIDSASSSSIQNRRTLAK